MGDRVTCLCIYGVILKFVMLGTPDSHIQREEERVERAERAERQRHRHRQRETKRLFHVHVFQGSSIY